MTSFRTTTSGLAVAGLMAASAGIAHAAGGTVGRPAAEHVPSSIKSASVMQDSGSAASKRMVTGAKALRLVKLFDGLHREPSDIMHCDVAGGPTTVVSFYGAKHVWQATESACTNVQVTRDGKRLPTLLPSKAWTAAVAKDLRG